MSAFRSRPLFRRQLRRPNRGSPSDRSANSQSGGSFFRSLAGSPSSGNNSSATQTPKQTSSSQTASGATVNTKASGSSSTSVPASVRKSNSAANAKNGNSTPASAPIRIRQRINRPIHLNPMEVLPVPPSLRRIHRQERPAQRRPRKFDTSGYGRELVDSARGRDRYPGHGLEVIKYNTFAIATTGVSRFVLRRRHRHSVRPGECLVPIRSIVDRVQTTVKRTVSAEWHKRRRQHVRVAGLGERLKRTDSRRPPR